MLCDVIHDAEAPIVFTGAIRPASAPGRRRAGEPRRRGQRRRQRGGRRDGRAGRASAARSTTRACVRKTDTTSLVAFSSPQTGPLGRVTEGHPTIWSRIPRNPPLDPPHLDGRVLVVPTAAGDDGALARAALDTEPDGVVIGTLGAGHLAPTLLELWAEAAERIPVVAYCRPERGVILNATYGYRGSERDLRETRDHPRRLPLPAGGADEAARLPRLRPDDRRGPLGVSPGRRLVARGGAPAVRAGAPRSGSILEPGRERAVDRRASPHRQPTASRICSQPSPWRSRFRCSSSTRVLSGPPSRTRLDLARSVECRSRASRPC